MADRGLIEAVQGRALRLLVEDLSPAIETLLVNNPGFTGTTHQVDLVLRDGRRLLLRMTAEFLQEGEGGAGDA
jgi:hypothetical protein